MAYDPGLLETLRAAVGDITIVEKRMFGGVALMHRGHTLCGVTKDGAVFRIGKENQARALAMEGVGPMNFTGKPMGGFVATTAEFSWGDEDLHALIEIAQNYVTSLPPK